MSLALVSLCLFVTPVAASEARISEARTLLADGVYRVGAQIELDLNETLLEALHSGVPLSLDFHIEVLRERRWLWPDRVAHLRQRFILEYHALSRAYPVFNYSTGERYSFGDLASALEYIGTLYDLPLIDANLLEPEQTYWVRMRADLDVETLPTPVRLWAYLGSDWSLHSDWYQWSLQP